MVHKLSVTTPAFLPPIPRGQLGGLEEEDEGMLAAERYLMSEVENGSEAEEEQGEGGRPRSVSRPRTKQDMRLKDNNGSLYVGFSGVQRPLAPVTLDTVDGRGGTPWLERGEGDERIDLELAFMLEPGMFRYES